jgi:hypothetical protein
MKNRHSNVWFAPVLIAALLLATVGCSQKPLLILPIRGVIDTHTITPGFAIRVINQGIEPMRWKVTVNRGGNLTQFVPVVDNGHFFEQRGLVQGDSVTIEADGYQSQTFTVP